MKHVDALGESGTVEWTGRSGRRYWMRPVAPAEMKLTDDTIGVLTVLTEAGEIVVWSGSAGTLIAEPASRNLFRAALPRAAAAYLMPAPHDEIDRVTVLWDLESATRPSSQAVA